MDLLCWEGMEEDGGQERVLTRACVPWALLFYITSSLLDRRIPN